MKKLLYTLFGVAIGICISTATPALASTVKSITAKINTTINVVVNGEKVKLSAQPINYNNLNYLPIGEIGRVLDINVKYDKQSDSIIIEDTNLSMAPEVKTPQASNPGNSKAEEPNIQTVKLGESVAKDGITISIDKVEYMPNGEVVDGVISQKGFKVYYSITNNSHSEIRSTGKFQFKLNDANSESIVNNTGVSYVLDKFGVLSSGESAKGYAYIEYPNDITVFEVTYTPVSDSKYFKAPIGKWSNY
ncbi:Telomeric repeat-binding factor 2 [compost metagenome]